MYQVEYAALKYYNSPISEECLYIGVLYHNITTDQRDFRHISNFKRFEAFDDEADVEFVKMFLKGMGDEVTNNLFNRSEFNMKEFTKVFVNEFRFTEMTLIEAGENENYVDNITKLYLKFDLRKKDRLSNKEEKMYIRQILSSKNVQFMSPEVDGKYEERITFDYVFGNTAIKMFSFKDKNLKRIIPTAKQWSFTAEEFSDKMEVVFLYDDLAQDEINLNIILQILKRNARVYQLQEGLEYLLNKTS